MLLEAVLTLLILELLAPAVRLALLPLLPLVGELSLCGAHITILDFVAAPH